MTRTIRLAAVASLALLVAGCSSTFTSKAPVSRAYVLYPASTAAAASSVAAVDAGGEPARAAPVFAGALRISRPVAGPGFETDRILLLRADRQLDFYANGHWAGPIPDMIGALAGETLRPRSLFTSVYGDGTPLRSDYFLQIVVRAFLADYSRGGDSPVALVLLDCTLVQRLDRTVLANFTARGEAPAAANRMTEVVAAQERALQQALESVVTSLAAAAP